MPIPILTNVSSIGDAFIAAGLGWFVFSTLLRGKEDPLGGVSLGPGRPRRRSLRADRAPAASASSGRSSSAAARARHLGALPAARPLGAQVRGHPYVRLALDARFAASGWPRRSACSATGSTRWRSACSSYALTDSPLLTGLVFLAATLPNLFLGPIAGTFVDRWEHKRVMVASDLIRAALVLAIPFAATANIFLVYPLVFLITTVSLFFRPAKTAMIPRIVREDDVMAANSATWTADTLADIVGFPLAGLFVAFLGPRRRPEPGVLRRLRDLRPQRPAAGGHLRDAHRPRHGAQVRQRGPRLFRRARRRLAVPARPARAHPEHADQHRRAGLVGRDARADGRLRERRPEPRIHPLPAELRRDRDGHRHRQPGRRARRRCAGSQDAQGLAGRGRASSSWAWRRSCSA